MIAFGYPPMEMRAAATIPDGPEWLYEPKWDGFRCLVHASGGNVDLQSKNGQPLGRYFPEIVAALAAIGRDFVLDGELVVPVAGAFSFDALQQRIHPAASRVTTLSKNTPATYLAFDLLSEGSIDIADRPLVERRERLEHFAPLFGREGVVRLSPATRDRAIVDDWFSRVGGALDGVVAKRLDRAYASGSRDAAVKVKRERTADCVVGGFRYAKGSKTAVGSLLLGLFNDAGLLDHIGFCSAFPNAERIALLKRVLPFVGGAGFTGDAPDTAQSRWTRGTDTDRSYVALAHELVLEAAFDQVTGGRIRHGARAVRWRTDKDPHGCTIDQLENPGSAAALLD